MHFSKYHKVAQNPQGLLNELLLDGPFRRQLPYQIGVTYKNKQLLSGAKMGARVFPPAQDPGHPGAFLCGQAHTAVMFTHTAPES